MATSGPTTEIGRATNSAAISLPTWSTLVNAVDDREYAPDVRWPKSIETYDRMETDAQVRGLLLGMFLPIRRMRWSIDPNGARDEIVEGVARDFNLPILGQDAPPAAGRDRNRFSHDRHLSHTLRALVYGHYFFEQVGEIVDGRWKLRKLAPRPPYTIAKGGGIKVASDGGLEGITQGFGLGQKVIPVDRLVAYVWDQEAANWFGRSLLRACFKNWLIKDRLLRVDAQRHERNSMGIPWFETDKELDQAQVDALAAAATRIRAGEESGGAGPGKLQIKGVEGSVSDVLDSIRYADQQMNMATLEMFADLGRNSETGSRSLGDSFIDWFKYAQETVAGWHADVTTEHAIWDWVDWNYGGDEGAPALIHERAETEQVSVGDLKTLIDADVVVVDDPLRAAFRERYDFPPPDPDTAVPPPAPSPEPAPPEPTVVPPVIASKAGERRRSRTVAAASSSLSLPDRELRRQPYTQEVQAKVDYELMDAQMTSEIDKLVAKVKALQVGQVDQLSEAIETADGDLGALALIEADPVFADAIGASLEQMGAQGIAQAVGEATRQGITPVEPDLDASSLTARAANVDTLLTRSLSEAAARRASALTGGSLTPTEVASQVKDYLGELSDSYLQEQLGGTMVQAMNTGRKAVFAANEPKYLYASELLDQNACEECTAIDGTEYASLEDAEADYPTGGYCNCEGGPRCRGTLIAVYVEEEEPSE